MNVAVIFGGESCEHDISIITGEQLISACDEFLYKIFPIYVDKNGTWLTSEKLVDIDTIIQDSAKANVCTFIPNDNALYIKKRGKFKRCAVIDMVFVCMHGLRGEDGCVAGVLELSKIPYSSSSICASSVCMDKCVFKTFAKGLGINVVDGISVCEREYLLDYKKILSKVKMLEFPVIIKPSRQGSSIGIEVCKSEDDFENKLKKAFLYDKKLLIEKFVCVEKEINVAVFENRGDYVISFTEEPIAHDEILSFDNKYRKNAGGFETIKRIMPANISKEIDCAVRSIALDVYKSLEMSGVVRFDFILDKDGVLYLNEVNTIPGSMANYLFDKDKYNYSTLLSLWISNAIKRYQKSLETERFLKTDVLINDFDGFKK